MKNILITALILSLAFGFIFFYQESQELFQQNQELIQNLDNLQTQIITDGY